VPEVKKPVTTFAVATGFFVSVPGVPVLAGD